MTPKHQTGIFILKLKIFTPFRDIVHLPTAHFTE